MTTAPVRLGGALLPRAPGPAPAVLSAVTVTAPPPVDPSALQQVGPGLLSGLKPSGTRALVIVACVLLVVGILWMVFGPRGSGSASAAAPPAAPPVHLGTAAAPPQRQLMRRTVTPGTGPEVQKGDTVTCNYTGRFWDGGAVFDTTDGRGPFSFTVGEGRVIPAWDGIFPGLREGEKLQLRVPSRLGYGPKGQPGQIPPDSDLEFDIDVLKVTRPAGAPVAATGFLGATAPAFADAGLQPPTPELPVA